MTPPTAVLASGGMDSCILLANVAERGVAHPIYVETGIPWEWAEKRMLSNFIKALDHPNIKPITTLSLPVKALYGETHWTMSGETVPSYDDPDETIYIPGRNIILITLASIWCSLNGVHRIVIGSLAGNPFPDATPDFFQSIANANGVGLDHQIIVEAPMRNLHKEDILVANASTLPLHLTLTCSNPQIGDNDVIIHCADCNKCRERHEAYVDAGVPDDTLYSNIHRSGSNTRHSDLNTRYSGANTRQSGSHIRHSGEGRNPKG